MKSFPVLWVLRAVPLALLFKRRFSTYDFNGDKFTFKVHLTWRRYSPFCWLLIAAGFFVYLFDGGLKKWWQDLKEIDEDSCVYGSEVTLRTDKPMFLRRIIMWRLTYGD